MRNFTITERLFTDPRLDRAGADVAFKWVLLHSLETDSDGWIAAEVDRIPFALGVFRGYDSNYEFYLTQFADSGLIVWNDDRSKFRLLTDGAVTFPQENGRVPSNDDWLTRVPMYPVRMSPTARFTGESAPAVVASMVVHDSSPELTEVPPATTAQERIEATVATVDGEPTPPAEVNENGVTIDSLVTELVGAWNDLCVNHSGAGLRRVMRLTRQRRERAARRLSDPAWPWREALTHIPVANDNQFNWQPTFDWLIKNEENATRLAEGQFDNRDTASANNQVADAVNEFTDNTADLEPF